MDGRSQTEQYPLSAPAPDRVLVTRRHHPLEGQELDVVRGGRSELTVRNPDSATMRIPRAWTDADGVMPPTKEEPSTQLTIDALRALMRLVDALGDRR